MSTEYKRERKEEKPVLAICYDFDKTLSPDDMQAQGFIQSVGYDVETFWKKSNGLASGNDMDQNLAYMLMMQQAAEGKKLFTRGELMKCGKEVVLFPGVKDWFKRICTYGEEHGVLVEHYLISSGLKEMIEGTDVAGEFKKIYASSFFYNEKGVAIWPAQVVNYTNKTQFLFRIEKGVLDINDPGVNDSFAPDEMRVPFRNMVYIGDSDTDVPCMKLVNVNGGYSIGVYNADTKDKTKVYKMMRENRIKYYAPADYSEGRSLISCSRRSLTVRRKMKLWNPGSMLIRESRPMQTSRRMKPNAKRLICLSNWKIAVALPLHMPSLKKCGRSQYGRKTKQKISLLLQ